VVVEREGAQSRSARRRRTSNSNAHRLHHGTELGQHMQKAASTLGRPNGGEGEAALVRPVETLAGCKGAVQREALAVVVVRG
jgi:hypothetical protein